MRSGAPPQNCLSSIVVILFPHILTDARNALLLLAVTHVRYGVPHGKNKENNACNRLIFLNLQPNGIPRIIEHVQNPMFVLTKRTNVYTQHNLSDFHPKECYRFRNLSEKQRQMMFFVFQGQEVLLRAKLQGPPGLLRKPDVFSRFPQSLQAF